MIYGYARVSSDDQDTTIQRRELEKYGCQTIFEENKSGATAGRWDRPQLHKALESLWEGDTFVVWKLDRLSRSLSDLLHILTRIEQAGATFESVTERIETKSPSGRLMMQMLGCFAEFERAMIKERTKIGIARARAEGRVGNAKNKLSAAQQAEALAMLRAGRSQTEIAEIFEIHKSTVCRLAKEGRVLAR
jgi:DNA invertase Pin-like site-specific DNA recombinase